MKTRLFALLRSYLFFILFFVVQKPIFMLYHWNQASKASLGDWFAVMWHGLPLDFSTAAYLVVLPALLLLASIWVDKKYISPFMHVYSIVMLLVTTLIFLVDIELYSYWGFRIDTTPLFYLNTPKDALASVSVWMLMLAAVCFALYYAGAYWLFRRFVLRSFKNLPTIKPLVHRALYSLCMLLITGLLFLPIRGGVTVSTMNVGKVYFSDVLFLNHAAVNPAFNLMASFEMENNLGEQYRFMDPDEAHRLFAELKEKPIAADSIPSLLNQQRPNVILILLESFMSSNFEKLGGLPVAENLNRLCDEGVLFTHMYANSFRTDRGIISVLSGYPAQPTFSIMKIPAKSQSLPSIQKSLKNEGYACSYYYGGDADFTNMRSYLMSSGIEEVISDTDFPLKDRLSKWGAQDHVLVDRLINDLQQPPHQPFFTIVQTLSSHEPFDVPMQRNENPYLNSVAYTDSCLGVFIETLKQSPLWKNTLLVFVPDHTMRYPDTIQNTDPNRYKIPIIWAGGAISKPMRVERYGSQIDLAATLLYQLGIDHSDFTFSKNLLNPNNPQFGFFTFVDGFGFASPQREVVYDHAQKKVVYGDPTSEEVANGKAFLQCLYDDLAKR